MNTKKILLVASCTLLVAAGYLGIKGYAERLAETKLQEAIADFEFYADISFGKVKVNLFGMNAHVNEVILSPIGSKEKIFIDEIIIYDLDNKNEIPAFAHIKLKGFHSDSSGMAENFFKNLGYAGDTKLNIELDYAYRKNERIFNCDRFSYSAHNIGTLNLKYQISNFDFDPDSLLSLDSSFPNILIHNTEISFHNESLVQRFFQRKAEEEGREVATIRQEMIELIDEEISGTNEPFFQETLQSLKEFIKNPDKITVELAPETPISLDRILEIKNLKEAAKLLNAKVKI